MRIIILGASQVGRSLARTLVDERHDVTLIDQSSDALHECSEQLDIRTIQGRCSYPDVLHEANADEADMLIAVTDSDEVNMVACQVAYSLFHVPIKIARIRSPHYFVRKELFGKERLPIDLFISPEKLITDTVLQQLAHPGSSNVVTFSHPNIKFVSIKPYYGGPMVGKTLHYLYQAIDPQQANILAIFRKGESIPLTPDTILEVGDDIYCIALSGAINQLIGLLRRSTRPYKSIMIAGGGNLGKALTMTLSERYQIKLIDHNQALCQQLAEQLSHATVLCSDTADKDMLINEKIDETDLFIALTNNDETNILSGVLAKNLGAHRVMALVNRPAYIDLLSDGSINSIISPQDVTIGSILTHIRQGDIVRVHALRRGKAEIIEVVAHGDEYSSRVINKRVGDLELPPATIVCGIIRGKQTIIANHDTLIESQDHIIFLVLDKTQLRALEKLFKVSAHFF